MDKLDCRFPSMAKRGARKRTRSQRCRWHGRQRCRVEHGNNGNGNGIDNCDGGNSPSRHPYTPIASPATDAYDVSTSSSDAASTVPRSGSSCTKQKILSLTAVALLICTCTTVITYANAAPSLNHGSVRATTTASAFVSPISRRHEPMNHHPLMSIQRKTPETKRNTVDRTWSNAVRQNSELNESRFGVRKRVKSVLKKAKKRTGNENSSTATTQSPSRSKRVVNGESSFVQSGLNIVAETASIGGLEAVIVDDEGTVDVALDYKASNRSYNNDTNSNSIETSGEKYEDPALLTKLADGTTPVNGAKASSAPSAAVSKPSMAPAAFQRPEDDFVQVRKSSSDKTNNDTAASKAYGEKDAFTGDVSAAFSLPREPLPFELPTLDAEQSRRVKKGERIQFQDDMGRAGSGFVVWDVKAPASVVWDCLLDFQSYPQTIPTVREVVMYTNTHLKEDYRAEKPVDFEDGTAAICKHGVPSVTRAQFQLSKFRLKIAAVHKYRPHPKGDYMIFTLDPASTNMVLKFAKGIWYTESNPDGKEGYTRVWLLCELRVSRILPQWIVDYAAKRAMPRATTWLKPQTEAAAMLWLKDSAKR